MKPSYRGQGRIASRPEHHTPWFVLRKRGCSVLVQISNHRVRIVKAAYGSAHSEIMLCYVLWLTHTGENRLAVVARIAGRRA